MFPLSHSTRRTVCVLIFLGAGVVPAMLCAAWCIARHRPERVPAAAAELSREMGLRVALGDLEYVRPGVVRYKDLTLTHPETGRTVLSCSSVEASWIAVEGDSRRPSLALTISGLEIESNGLEELGRLVSHVMQSRTRLVEPGLQLTTDGAVLRSPGGTIVHALSELQATMETLPGGIQAQVAFRLAGQTGQQPLRLWIGRNRQTSPPATGFDFSTGEAFVPCDLLAMVLPDLGLLGPRSRFQGRFWASCPAEGWQGALSGRVAEVELDRLMDQWSTHRLTGTAWVVVQTAQFRRSHLEKASGAILANSGVISRSLLSAAVQRPGPGPLRRARHAWRPGALWAVGAGLLPRCARVASGRLLPECGGRDRAGGPLPAAALRRIRPRRRSRPWRWCRR